jgi:hypothetical protein
MSQGVTDTAESKLSGVIDTNESKLSRVIDTIDSAKTILQFLKALISLKETIKPNPS